MHNCARIYQRKLQQRKERLGQAWARGCKTSMYNQLCNPARNLSITATGCACSCMPTYLHGLLQLSLQQPFAHLQHTMKQHTVSAPARETTRILVKSHFRLYPIHITAQATCQIDVRCMHTYRRQRGSRLKTLEADAAALGELQVAGQTSPGVQACHVPQVL
jgi:hypothetical protein